MTSRTFLFLQSPPGRFVAKLAREIRSRGHHVLRINLCLGDRLQWSGPGATSFRGSYDGWRDFLADYIRRHGVTDILYYGDRLPYHRVAMEVADDLGVTTTVYEFGYLRPDWITLERRGMSSLSHFPNDRVKIHAAAEGLPAPDMTVTFPHGFATEAFHEVVHHLSTYFGRPFYPRYNADAFYNPLLNYLSYIPRLMASGRRGRRAFVRTAKWIESGRRYMLVPLQMQNDYQLRANSPFRHQSEAIDLVLRSLAASPDRELGVVFKIHPLDNGWERWSHVVGAKANALGLGDRFTTIDGGHLPTLLDHAEGVILINSTVGISSILKGRPTKVLGMATFDIPGLTHQGPLDTFWTTPEAPDPAVRDAFLRLLANSIQIKGSFYNRAGMAKAATEIADRLITGTVNEPGAFVDPPPRLEKARQMGVPFLDQAMPSAVACSSAARLKAKARP
ncbi:MAG: capsular biosynthesis protein [Hyphomicrobiaceae bacterium]|nr:capsular biosynthesis protein [Hyphomicrobiaceae bacterium]